MSAARGREGSVLPILMYHFLADEAQGASFTTDERPYVVDPRLFGQHLDWLLAEGYVAISISRYLEGQERRRSLPERPIVITFDDGHISGHELAFPELVARRMVATFFLITDRVGSAGYVGWPEVEEMARADMEIGSHTASHRALTALAPAALQDELVRPKVALSERVFSRCYHLSLPFGFRNARVLAAALEHYDTVSTSDFGLNPVGAARILRRLIIRRGLAAHRLGGLLDDRSWLHRSMSVVDVARRSRRWVLGHYRRGAGTLPAEARE